MSTIQAATAVVTVSTAVSAAVAVSQILPSDGLLPVAGVVSAVQRRHRHHWPARQRVVSLPIAVVYAGPSTRHVAKVKCYIADVSVVGAPGCFRMNNGHEFTSAVFATCCDESRIRREYKGSDIPKDKAVVDSAVWRVMKGGT